MATVKEKPRERGTVGERFEAFHAAHPEVYRAFVRYAFELKASGVKRGSASMIFERLRWDAVIKGDKGAKLNNDFRAPYARWAMMDRPELAGFFTTRQLGVHRKPRPKKAAR